jgi:hypothetical protein
MKPVSSSKWEVSRPVILAQIRVDQDWVIRIGGILERPVSEGGQLELAIFQLDQGEVVALIRIDGNSTSGFTLLARESDHISSALERFILESGIDGDLVTGL